MQEEGVVVEEAPRPLPPKYKPKVGDLVSGKVNGVSVVGKVTRVSGGGTVTAEYGNGKEFVTSTPVPDKHIRDEIYAYIYMHTYVHDEILYIHECT